MNRPPRARLLHRMLGIGLTILAVVFLVLRSNGVEVLPDPAPVIGYTFAGLVIVQMAVAWLILKPLVPERGPRQSVEEYWSTPAVTSKVFLVWFVMDGAGILGAVGYFLTGQPAAAALMALAIVAFWLCGPGMFGK